MNRIPIVVLAFLLCASGCGSGSSGSNGAEGAASEPAASATGRSPDEQRVVKAIERTMKRDLESTPRLSRARTCLATGWVDRFGLEKLKEYGFLNGNLRYDESGFSGKMSTRDARSYLNVELQCVGYKNMVADMVGPDQPDTDPYVVACTRAVTEREVREAFVVALSGRDFEATPFTRKLTREGCGFEGD